MTILTANSPEFAELAALTVANKRQYAERHGYKFIHAIHPPGKTLYQIGWERATLWREVLPTLGTNEWLWFLGCDTLIMNHEISANDRCSRLTNGEADMLIGLDALGINCDSWFIRKCKRSIDFLDYVVSQEGKLPNEQEALWQGIGELRIDCVIRPQRLFNSYLTHLYPNQPARGGTHQPGDFVLHLPALGYEHRISLIRHYLTEVHRMNQRIRITE